ncbi:glycosyltransferase [Clostridium sp. MB05]|uniref:glycosyltransferase n=1 Tax=Clostridium sp. MB05 TaxID=3376682 RepID=UPI003981D4FF
MDTLSVCIIARNEEENILRCLKSIEDIADEIILIDTGSIDNTITIAQKFNANIIEFPWNNDFSLARNKALENATKDWILYIDCDESLDITQVYTLKNILDKSSHIGFRLKLINIIDNKPYCGEYLLRLIKNNCGFYFSGKINETIKNSIYTDSYENNILNLDIILYNYGYDLNQKKLYDRCNRNISIYLSYKDEEKDYLYYYNLANEYFLLKNLKKAIDNYIIAIYLSDNFFINSYITFTIIKAYFKMRKYDTAILIGEKLLDKYDAFREIYLLLGICYEKIGNLDKSKENLRKYLKLFTKGSNYYFSLDYINMKNLIPEMFGFNIETLKHLN